MMNYLIYTPSNNCDIFEQNNGDSLFNDYRAALITEQWCLVSIFLSPDGVWFNYYCHLWLVWCGFILQYS